jgi:hypothetical protein
LKKKTLEKGVIEELPPPPKKIYIFLTFTETMIELRADE